MDLCQLANPYFISLFLFFAFLTLDSRVFYSHTIMSIARMRRHINSRAANPNNRRI
ncbi:hypothetical protein BN2364_1436 [Alloalcanivorax xenomutans]|jgi:hypothetical protein|nr:hypothetical protein BN2364_1436 [Alloalcanivorax xenomutans]|tara:strand:- start:3232 stop:3399 length:168 start_codon:yes stop_codon:yes gene_type:complete